MQIAVQAEDVKHYGEWMRARAWDRIGDLYPQVDLPNDYGGGKATVIAWIWSRTVPSPDPAFSNVDVPIASSFLLSSKPGKEAWIEPVVDKKSMKITYRIRNDGTKAEAPPQSITECGEACLRKAIGR
jgi:putative DNA methylase